MRPLGIATSLLAAALLLSGCTVPSAYDQTYERESHRLEGEQAERDAAERAAHEEARRYAAVVYFDVGSAVVKPEGLSELGWLVNQLRPYPKAILEVRGFADATGGDAVNQKLSDERAANVANHLVSLGMERARVVTSGYASEIPAASDATAKGRKSNRRVEVTVR
jgi:outer membrane protein OmpA-like peptidoglycan-associated protein